MKAPKNCPLCGGEIKFNPPNQQFTFDWYCRNFDLLHRAYPDIEGKEFWADFDGEGQKSINQEEFERRLKLRSFE